MYFGKCAAAALLLLCIVAHSETPAQPDADLLSFERMGTGAPGGWKVEGDDYTWSAEAEKGPLGVGAARIAFGGSGNLTLCSPARAMHAEAAHTVALWLRSEPAGVSVTVEVIDNDKGDSCGIKDTFTAESGWRMFQARGVLPKSLKDRYYLRLRVEGSACMVWMDGLWLGEADKGLQPLVQPLVPGANWQPSVHPAGVALEPEAPWGVTAGDATLRVKARVVGATTEGCLLRLHAVNTLGAAAGLPPIPLDTTGVWNGGFDVSGDVAKPFGMLRIEGTVVDAQGRAISPMSETLLARVPEPIPGPLPESYFGVHVAPREPDAAVVAKLGYKWCRMHDATGITKWGHIEPEPGHWLWHDDGVALLRSHGLSILGMLDSAPPWHTGADPKSGYFSIYHAPKDIALWRNYVRQIVTHYAGAIDDWEVWNEPWDMRRFFQGGTPRSYAELLKAAYQEAKAANPKSTIIGVDTYPPLWEMAVLASGAYPYYDLLSWHRYDPALQGRPNDAIARVAERLRKAQKPYGKPKPILCTEGGPDVTVFHGSFFSFADPAIMGDWSEGADRYARLYLSMIAAGNKRFIAYSLHNNTYHGWLTHMMAEPGYLLRPMHAALAGLAHFVDGAQYESRLCPASDISAHVFNQPNARPYAEAPSTVVVLAADGPDPEDLPRPLPGHTRCFDRWSNPIEPPTQATRSPVYLVASAAEKDELLRALQPESSPKTPNLQPSIATLLDSALGALANGNPSLWTLFSAQGSLAVIGEGGDAFRATRQQLRSQPESAARFRLPSGIRISDRVVNSAGPFTVGAFDLASGGRKWAATYVATPDGPGGAWRFTALTILPDDGPPRSDDAARVRQTVSVWETALREASTANLLGTLTAGPACLMAATLNGEYFVFDNAIGLAAMMNTAVLFGPAAVSKMDLSRIAISGRVATVLGRWELAQWAFGLAPYAIAATLVEEDGAWKIVTLCASD